MGGLEFEDQPLCRSLWDEGVTPLEVVEGGSEGRGDGGSGDKDCGRYRGRDGNMDGYGE